MLHTERNSWGLVERRYKRNQRARIVVYYTLTRRDDSEEEEKNDLRVIVSFPLHISRRTYNYLLGPSLIYFFTLLS